MVLFCKICNYSTNSLSNFNKHKNTKKHFQKSISISSSTKYPQNPTQIPPQLVYTCPFCCGNYSRLDSLKRHTKSCRYKSQQIRDIDFDHKSQIMELTNELEKATMQANFYKERFQDSSKQIDIIENSNKILRDETKFNRDLVNNAGKLVDKSVGALTFVSKTYPNAPPLTKFNNYKALKAIKQGDHKLADIVIYHRKRKKLVRFIAKYIILEYKKENPFEQSIWNSDTSRLSYIIREMINNKPEWRLDKGGLKIDSYIVQPVTKYIKKEVEARIVEIRDYAEDNVNDLTDDQFDFELEKIKYAKYAIIDIDSGDLTDGVIKYLSNHFYLDRNKPNDYCMIEHKST